MIEDAGEATPRGGTPVSAEDRWIAGQVVRMKARQPFAGIFLAYIHCVGDRDTYLHTISPHTGAEAWLIPEEYRIVEVAVETPHRVRVAPCPRGTEQ